MFDPYTTSVTGLSRSYSNSFPWLSLRLFSHFLLSFLCHMRCTQHTDNSKPSYASITKWKLWNTFCNSPAKWLCNGRIWNSDCNKWAGSPVPSNIFNTKFIFILNNLQIKIKYVKKKKRQKIFSKNLTTDMLKVPRPVMPYKLVSNTCMWR